MKALVITALAAATLAACGGGGGSPAAETPAAATEVPATAGASVQAFVGYLGGLAAEDRMDALGTDALATAPTSDTDEPMALE
jgi:hypothetical protein